AASLSSPPARPAQPRASVRTRSPRLPPGPAEGRIPVRGQLNRGQTPMRSFVVVAILLAFLPPVAQPKEVYVHGEGTRSCPDYLRHREQGSANQDYFYATWIRGFLAGYSVATS